MLKQARKSLGKVKCVLLDELPYRSAVRSIPAMRDRYRPFLSELPKLPPCSECLYEIHMLCGSRDVDMGIWASWSMLRFLDGKGRFFVHSDGSLTDADADRWRSVIGDLVVVRRDDADAKIRSELAETTEHVYDWRCSNWASAQLVDVHYYGEAPTLLVMDSDVLTFLEPTEVMDALTAESPRFAWCSDLRESYSAEPEVLREATGVDVARRLCAGFLVTPRLSHDDFLRLDGYMAKMNADPRISLTHFWSCQTYYALLAGENEHSRMFSDVYSNIAGVTGEERVMRHYVGIPKVRFRYFAEGLPRIAKQVGL